MNQYDDVRLDVAALLAEQQAKLKGWSPDARSSDGLGLRGRLRGLAVTGATAGLYALRLYPRLVHANLILWWFEEFRDYWVGELGNRPIQPHDFHYLHCHYRRAFQQVGLGDGDGAEAHLEAWQDHRTVGLLFRNQYKLALHPLVAWRYRKYIPRGGHVLEFGAGMGPIASSIVNHFRSWGVRITCADIPTILHHYLRWKFRDLAFVRTVSLDPDEAAPLDEDYDTIFCQAVMEHLPRPVQSLQHFDDRLKPGGHLVFDYIRSEGQGLDTPAALRDRQEALQLVRERYEVVEGDLHVDDRSLSTVVCRKPR